MSSHLLSGSRLFPLGFWSSLLFTTPLMPAVAQVSVLVQGGVHAARLDRPERMLRQATRGTWIEGTAGEATTFGLRLGTWLSSRWGVDAGLAWSRNRSWQGSVGGTPPDFETHTIFSSVTARARLTPPDSRWGLQVGAGPALMLHAGSGRSLLTRNTDVGALVNIGGSLQLDPRLALTLDAHEYLFSSRFAEPYTPVLGGAPLPAGSRFRREFVLLAGLFWRAH
jgi:hypothetical protein